MTIISGVIASEAKQSRRQLLVPSGLRYQGRAYRGQTFQGAQDLRLIVGQMADEDVGVADFPEGVTSVKLVEIRD